MNAIPYFADQNFSLNLGDIEQVIMMNLSSKVNQIYIIASLLIDFILFYLNKNCQELRK